MNIPGGMSIPGCPSYCYGGLSGGGAVKELVNSCTRELHPERCPEDSHALITTHDKNLIFGLEFTLFMLLGGLFVYFKVWSRRQSRMVLESGDMVQRDEVAQSLLQELGPQEAGYFRGFGEVEQPINLQFTDLGLKLKGSGRQILEGVNGDFKSGRVAAIMGPSGAGKTTLLNVLCGKATYGETTGTLLINGEVKSIDAIKDDMGFVPQEDIVHEMLTVRENLMSAAQLKHGAAAGKKEIVEDVIRIMQMAHIQESIVGGATVKGISGGQRKRVNIGMELVGYPSVLFLDEPTSGLDSTTSLSVVHSLSLLARLNMCIIMVIHQPRYTLFTLFDDVCLLGVGGWTAYFGASQGCMPYFNSLGFQMPSHENPADFFMDAISGEVKPVNQPNFKVYDLKSKWKSREEAAVATEGQGRQISRDDAYAIVANNLETEWRKVLLGKVKKTTGRASQVLDDASGELDMDDLGTLLMNILGRKVSDETLAGIWKEIAPANSTTVKTDDLLGFLTLTATSPQRASRDNAVKTGISAIDTRLQAIDATLQSNEALQSVIKPLLGNRFRTVANRQPPGCLAQFFKGNLHRRLIVWWRSIGELCFFCALSFMCAIIMGIFTYLMLQDPGTLTQVYAAWIFQMITAVMVAIKCSFVFEDKPIFWRERNRGMSVASFFTARVLIDYLFAVVPMTTIFFTAFYPLYTMANPEPQVAFVDWYIPTRLLTLVASGWGYLVSAALPTRLASVGSVIVIFILMAVGSPPVVHQFVRAEAPWLEVVVLPMITRWSTQWIGAKIYTLADADAAETCMSKAAINATKAMANDTIVYLNEKCASGTLTLQNLEQHMTTVLKEDKYQSLMSETMKSASNMMSSRVKDAYLSLGLLHPYLDPYQECIVMLLGQAFLLYLATYLVLLFNNRDKQI